MRNELAKHSDFKNENKIEYLLHDHTRDVELKQNDTP